MRWCWEPAAAEREAVVATGHKKLSDNFFLQNIKMMPKVFEW